ncbi:Ras GTPase ras2 [Ceratobasidium sp. 423]|nr:Ras GTPase ras2 [Ceratobasidium sp. 423]
MDQWRVTALGDGAVGKTSIAVQFTLHSFTGKSDVSQCWRDDANAALPICPSLEAYDPTIEDAYRKQTMVDGSVCHIEIVDTAGQEEYSTLRDQWVREGQGFILVYSITERRSFERMETFRQALLRAKSRQPPLFILVGNKCDQTYERQVLKQEGENLAQQWGCEFMETSARTGQNIEKLFVHLIRSLRLVRDGAELPPEGGAPRKPAGGSQKGSKKPVRPGGKKGCIIS